MRTPITYPFRSLRRLWRNEEGAQLVEFALVLPIMLILFAAVIESGRMMLSYQTVIGGVRDATRYLARITPRDICETGGSVSDQADRLVDIVRESITGESVLGTGITVSGVDPSVDCVEGSFRFGDAPVVAVEATLNITLPFGQVFSLATGTIGPITTTVTDQQRVFGS